MAENFIIPIKRLELEFIKSNVTSFDHLIKIHIVRNPGVVGDLEFIVIAKFILDYGATELLSDNIHLLHYMSNAVYMSNDIFMGGLDIANSKFVKDSGTVTLESFSIKKFKYLLDYMLDPNDIHMYSLRYMFRGNEYQTDFVISYKPLEAWALGLPGHRPAITLRNLRFRGPNEAQKYTHMHGEIECDISRLEDIEIDVDNDIEEAWQNYDSAILALYNIMDQVKILQELLVDEEAEAEEDHHIDCKVEILGK